jgi:branched-chain amino acid aminotransferase
MKYCYLNAKILPENQAMINITDLGLLRGYAIFDFLRTYNSKTFLLKEHLERFRNSAKLINLKVPHTDKHITKIIQELLSKNNFKESGIRIVLTGGSEENLLTKPSLTFYILVNELQKFPDHVYTKGVNIVTCNFKRDLPLAKTTNYINAYKLKKWQNKQNAFEILYTYRNNIYEATRSNFFIIKKGKIITPKNGILFGITRNLVIKLAKKYFDIQERKLSIKELKEADEAFITSTTKEVAPVVQIDNQKIGSGEVGQNTKKIMEVFRDYITQYHFKN